MGSVSLAKLALLQTKAEDLARQADQSEGVTGFSGGPGGETDNDSFASLLAPIGASATYLRSDGQDAAWAALALADFPGGTDEQFLRGNGASNPPVYEAVIFSVRIAMKDPVAINIDAWNSRYPATVTNVRARRTGGTGATVNARRNGADNHLSSNLSLTTTNWTDGGAVQNTAYVADDNLQLMVVSVTGTPTQVAIQVDFTRP